MELYLINMVFIPYLGCAYSQERVLFFFFYCTLLYTCAFHPFISETTGYFSRVSSGVKTHQRCAVLANISLPSYITAHIKRRQDVFKCLKAVDKKSHGKHFSEQFVIELSRWIRRWLCLLQDWRNVSHDFRAVVLLSQHLAHRTCIPELFLLMDLMQGRQRRRRRLQSVLTVCNVIKLNIIMFIMQ